MNLDEEKSGWKDWNTFPVSSFILLTLSLTLCFTEAATAFPSMIWTMVDFTNSEYKLSEKTTKISVRWNNRDYFYDDKSFYMNLFLWNNDFFQWFYGVFSRTKILLGDFKIVYPMKNVQIWCERVIFPTKFGSISHSIWKSRQLTGQRV